MNPSRRRRHDPAIPFLLILALALGAPAAFAGTLVTDQPLIHDGVERSFHYFVPGDPPPGPLPLVLALHGGGGSADQIAGLTGGAAPWAVLMEVAEREGFLVVYPDGVDQQWNDCRGDSPPTGDADDVGFLGAVIDWAVANLDADPARLFATGVSNGGMMTLRLGHELGQRLAAIAPVVANRAADDECLAPTGPLPILVIDGTADPIVPWGGGEIGVDRGTVLSVRDTVLYWALVDGCSGPASFEELPDPDAGDESRITVASVTACAEGAEVRLYAVIGGGHSLPSSTERYSFLYELIVGKQNHDVEGAEEIWSFFSGHRRRD